MIRLYFFCGIVLIILLVGGSCGYLIGNEYGRRSTTVTHDQIISGLQAKIAELEIQAKTEKIRADTAENDYLTATSQLADTIALARRYRTGVLVCHRNSQAKPVPGKGSASSSADAGAASSGMGEQITGPDIQIDSIYAITRRCDDLTEQLRALQSWAR